jgi:hypothetical protein
MSHAELSQAFTEVCAPGVMERYWVVTVLVLADIVAVAVAPVPPAPLIVIAGGVDEV